MLLTIGTSLLDNNIFKSLEFTFTESLVGVFYKYSIVTTNAFGVAIGEHVSAAYRNSKRGSLDDGVNFGVDQSKPSQRRLIEYKTNSH